MYRGGRKRTRRIKRTYRRKQKTSSRRGKKTKQKLFGGSKIYGGNYLTGTIADGPGKKTAFGEMTGAQTAGSHYEKSSDVIDQPLGI
jgi:hypothetical protein